MWAGIHKIKPTSKVSINADFVFASKVSVTVLYVNLTHITALYFQCLSGWYNFIYNFTKLMNLQEISVHKNYAAIGLHWHKNLNFFFFKESGCRIRLWIIAYTFKHEYIYSISYQHKIMWPITDPQSKNAVCANCKHKTW